MNISNTMNPSATAMDSSTNDASTNSSDSATGGATISSTDFLTLLVAQLKNQDPTQPTDPTAYVQQLVGVNSLEQLIDINTQLTSLGGGMASAAPVTGA